MYNRRPRLPLARVLAVVVGVPLFAFLILPLFMVFPMAFNPGRYMQFPPTGLSTEWFSSVVHSSAWRSAALLSLEIGLMCTACAVTFGTLAAFAIARARFRGKTILYAFILSPLIVPEIIIAISMYFLATRVNMIGNPVALAAGQATLAIPAVVVVVASTVKGFDVRLERASRSLGANTWQTFWKVVFPLIRPAIATGALFAFLISFDDLLIALYLGGPTTQTVPRLIWSGLRFDTSPAIAVVSTILVSLALVALILGELLSARTARYRAESEALPTL